MCLRFVRNGPGSLMVGLAGAVVVHGWGTLFSLHRWGGCGGVRGVGLRARVGVRVHGVTRTPTGLWHRRHKEHDMTMFSSREPFNDDPEPFVSGLGNRHATNFNPALWHHDPRPEFDRPQVNPTNSILVAFRESLPYDYTAAEYSEIISDAFVSAVRGWSTAEVDHAHRVLNRLAVFEHVAP